MKVGNSMVAVIPKPIIENFGIKKGDTVKFLVTDKGLYIPLIQKKPENKETEKLLKELAKI